MACPNCHRRAALIAALAPAITRLSLRREALLGLLGLPNARLLRAAKIENPHELLRRLSHVAAPLPSESIPTSLCHHDPDYPEALAQLDSTPAVLHATCTTERLRELLTGPTVAILGDIAHTDYAQRIAFALAHDLATAGVTLIGGLYGLEKTAHHAALHANGHTIGVMPGGASAPYLPSMRSCTSASKSAAQRSQSSRSVSSLPRSGASSPANASSPRSPASSWSSRATLQIPRRT